MVRPGGDDQSRSWALALAIAVPLALCGLSFGLWWLSDRLGKIGPLDKAAFGWAVVIPAWLAAPVAAGFAWRDLAVRQRWAVALVTGAVITAAATALLWRAVTAPACEFGSIRPAAEWLLPALVGALLGVGVSASGLLSAGIARQVQRWRAALAGLVIGAAVNAATSFAALVFVQLLAFGYGCLRPPA